MRRRELAKRVAAVEKAKAPPPVIQWSPWQRIFTPEEDAFARVLAHRGARRGGGGGEDRRDDPAAWAALCRDDRERALLRGMLAKATHGPEGHPLYLYFAVLRFLRLPVEWERRRPPSTARNYPRCARVPILRRETGWKAAWRARCTSRSSSPRLGMSPPSASSPSA
jgi:hypothetical protein